MTAVLAGARLFAAIGEWAADLPRKHLSRIGLGSTASPDGSTLRKLFARLDADALDRVLGAWVWTRSSVIHGARVIGVLLTVLSPAQSAGWDAVVRARARMMGCYGDAGERRR